MGLPGAAAGVIVMRQDILDFLIHHKDEFVSGQQISDQLGISRTAVWKHIRALKQRGYVIECKNVGAILEAAGSGYDKVIKTTCFLADIADFAAFNEVYAKYFTSKPARSCVAVKDLPKGVLCEIEAVAEA